MKKLLYSFFVLLFAQQTYTMKSPSAYVPDCLINWQLMPQSIKKNVRTLFLIRNTNPKSYLAILPLDMFKELVKTTIQQKLLDEQEEIEANICSRAFYINNLVTHKENEKLSKELRALQTAICYYRRSKIDPLKSIPYAFVLKRRAAIWRILEYDALLPEAFINEEKSIKKNLTPGLYDKSLDPVNAQFELQILRTITFINSVDPFDVYECKFVAIQIEGLESAKSNRV